MLIILSILLLIIAQKSLHTNDSSSQLPSYICLNGKNPNTLTRKQILKEFAKGKCSPFVIVPGLLSSKLVVEINCDEFKQKHPQLFDLCGWTHCDKELHEFWKEVTNKEYLLWISAITGPLSVLSLFERNNYCWSGFMKLVVDFNKPIDEAVQETQGFKVRLYGSSSNTKASSVYGDFSISELSPAIINSRSTNLFKGFLRNMRDMGYIPGLTYQSLPYDFRLPLKKNQLTVGFADNIERLHKLTKKKVMIFGHSFGNNNIYTDLLNMDQNFKDEKIKAWVAIGAALSGAIKAFKALISGDPELILFYGTFGLHYRAGIQAANNFFTIYDLLLQNPFEDYKDEKWFEAIKQRMLYEQGKLPYEKSGFSFLPKITDKCSPKHFKGFKPDCRLGLYNQTDTYMIKIEDEKYMMTIWRN